MPGPLTDRVALVTGASRGAGRGIALELGAAGATVYVTGRTVAPGTGIDDLPGTVGETAQLITGRGGTGIAVRCDHTVDADIAALFAQIRAHSGRLDLLVNNAWGGYEDPQCRPLDPAPFWEQDLARFDRMFAAGVRSHLATTSAAVPLLLAGRGSLVVNTTVALPARYAGPLFYDVAKTAVNRMTWAMAHELQAHGVAVVGLAPGFMRTERVVAAFTRAGMAAALESGGGPQESTAYVGRAVVALATAGDAMQHSGRVLEVGALARRYGFTDADGKQPAPFTFPAAAFRYPEL